MSKVIMGNDYIHTYIHTYIHILYLDMVKHQLQDKNLKIKLIYMLAMWEYEEDNWRSILFLNLVKDLMALTLDGRLFHNCAPLYQKLRFKKSVRGFGRANLLSLFLSP